MQPTDSCPGHGVDCAIYRGFACDCDADPCRRDGAPCVSVLMPGEACGECGRVSEPEVY
jgi:hypothetical protein